MGNSENRIKNLDDESKKRFDESFMDIYVCGKYNRLMDALIGEKEFETINEFDIDEKNIINNNKLIEEIKTMRKDMTLLKKYINNIEIEIKDLKDEKNKLNLKIESLENENKLIKQLQDINNKEKICERNLKGQTIDINEITKKIDKENEGLNNSHQHSKNKSNDKEGQINEDNNKLKKIQNLLIKKNLKLFKI